MESKPGFVSAAPLLNYNRFRPFPWKRKLIAASFSFIIDSTGPINSEARLCTTRGKDPGLFAESISRVWNARNMEFRNLLERILECSFRNRLMLILLLRKIPRRFNASDIVGESLKIKYTVSRSIYTELS